MQDLDPVETQEWLDALESVLDREGEDRAHYLMTRMGELASRSGTQLPYAITTPYRNTIPVTHEARMPGDLFMERRIRSLVRWNALAMVMRANKHDPDLGGHISTFASSATLYDIGFNYFFQAPPTNMAATWCSSRATRPRRLRPRLPRRPHQRGTTGELPPGSGRQRPVLLSAPLADAGLLAVPHRIHGPWPVRRSTRHAS